MTLTSPGGWKKWIKDVIDKIDVVTTKPEKIKIIEATQAELFDLLETETAIWYDDEKNLEDLKSKFDDIWDDKELNDTIVDLKNKTRMAWAESETEPIPTDKASNSDKTTISGNVSDAFEDLCEIGLFTEANVEYGKLVGSWNPLDDIVKSISDPTKLPGEIKKFIKKDNAPFEINDTLWANERGEYVRYLVAYFTALLHTITKDKLSKTTANEAALFFTKWPDILATLKWIFHSNKQKDRIDKMYNPLKKLNEKWPDKPIDLGDKTLNHTDADPTEILRELHDDFESPDIDKLDYKISCTSWPDLEIDGWDLCAEHDEDAIKDLKYKGKKIWEVYLDNKDTSPNRPLFKVNLLSWTELNATASDIIWDFPLNPSFDIIGTKKIDFGGGKSWKVSLKKPLTMKISTWRDIFAWEELDLNAVISDMWDEEGGLHKESAAMKAEEEIKQMYKDAWKWWILTKAKIFFWRWIMRKNRIRKYMKWTAWKSFSDDDMLNDLVSHAADRHDLEVKQWWWKWIYGVKLEDTLSGTDLDSLQDLCQEYLTTWLSDAEFQERFNNWLSRPVIQGKIKNKLWDWVDAPHLGTNILLKLKEQKDHLKLIEDIQTKIESSITNGTDPTADVEKLIDDYIDTYKKNPAIFERFMEFKKNADLNKAKDEFKLYLNHQKGLMKARFNNVNISLGLLSGGKTAYNINNADREKNWQYKCWKWMDKHPWITTGATAATLMVWVPYVGTAIAWGWWVAALAGLSVGALNYVKKWTHNTKEQNTHEKNLVTDYEKTQKKIEEREKTLSKGKYYTSWKRYKAHRNLKLYRDTTQQIEKEFTTPELINQITELIKKWQKENDPIKRGKIEKNLCYWLFQWKARLDLHRKYWHNFLASIDGKSREKDMNNLENSLLSWLEAICWMHNKKDLLNHVKLHNISAREISDGSGANKIDLISSDVLWDACYTYNDILDKLKKDYEAKTAAFKKWRRKSAARCGALTGATTFGISLGMQYLSGNLGGNWGTNSGNTPPSWTEQPTPADTPLKFESAKEHFDLGKFDILDNWTQNDILSRSKDIFSHPSLTDWSSVTINFWWATDATWVIPGRLGPAVYEGKLAHVKQAIEGLHLDSNIEKSFIDCLKDRPWEAVNGGWFTNDALHGMRCAELLEETARWIAQSANPTGKWVELLLNFDPSLSIAWSSTHTASERFVQATYDVLTKATVDPLPPTPNPSTSGGWSAASFLKYLNFPVFWNQVKDDVHNVEA